MPSIDIDGTPLLILGLPDVKTLHGLLDNPDPGAQDRVTKKILDFINHPQCLAWEKEQDDRRP